MMRIRSYRKSNIIRKLLIHLIILAVVLLFLVPVALIITGSFTSQQAIEEHGYRLIPREFTLEAYRFLLRQPQKILRAYGVSGLVTAIGTVSGTLFTAMLAYAISRQDFIFRKLFSFLVFFTLLFSGGLVPLYILVTNYLKINNTIWSLILPLMINPFFVLVMRTFFKEIPQEYIDAAMLDGAGELGIFFRIVTPLAKPAFATIGMMYLLIFWNDWYSALLFITEPELYPLQFMLHQVLANVQFLQQNIHNVTSFDLANLMIETMRMAMAVIAAGPVTLVFLFFQKYYVRGLTVGGLKG
jgi:putative aldouronate transport system permease protein